MNVHHRGHRGLTGRDVRPARPKVLRFGLGISWIRTDELAALPYHIATFDSKVRSKSFASGYLHNAPVVISVSSVDLIA